DYFARALSPTEPVRFPSQRYHTDSVIFGVASRIPGDRDNISGLESLACDALTAQLSGSAPLHGPPLDLPLFIGRFHVDKRMRVAEEKLNQFSFNRNGLVFEVCRSKRMMRGCLRTRQHDQSDGENEESAFHPF